MAISLVCGVTVVALKLLTQTVDKQDFYNTACAHTHTHTPTLFPLDNSHRCLSGQFSKPTPVFELNIKAYHRISCIIGTLSPTSKKNKYIQLKPKRTANWQPRSDHTCLWLPQQERIEKKSESAAETILHIVT